MTNNVSATSNRLRRGVFQLAPRAMTNSTKVIAGTVFQKALLS